MATSKPRITVTLEPRVHEVLSRLSKVQGQSMSSIVSEFVEQTLPALERMVVILERAASMPDEVKAGFASSVGRAEQVLTAAAEGVLRQADLMLEMPSEPGATGAAGAGSVPTRAPSERGSTPVPVTRGSGSPKAPRKRPASKSPKGGASA